MKKFSALSVVLLLAAACSYGQGTLIYDQQSSTDESLPVSGASSLQDFASGQSFIPALAGVGFVKIMFRDANPNDGLGVAVYIGLRSGSVSGTLLGTTAPVTLPNAFGGAATFFFPEQVQLTPDVMYYFNVVPQSGGPFQIFGSTTYNYAGGTAFVSGHPDAAADLWFREGIIVPEPSSTALLSLGAVALLYLRRSTHT